MMTKVKRLDKDGWPMALLKLELSMVGRTVEEAKNNDTWYHDFTFTKEQYEQFKKKAMDILINTYKMKLKVAKSKLAVFDLQYGLRVV